MGIMGSGSVVDVTGFRVELLSQSDHAYLGEVHAVQASMQSSNEHRLQVSTEQGHFRFLTMTQ